MEKKIFDPKERTISVAPFRDRIVHHALIHSIEPVFERAFIYDSYATRKGKGTHRAVKRARCFLRKTPFFLKIDISHYFDSIDQDVLMKLVQKKIKDKNILKLIERIVKNSDVSRGLETGKGLPIGNLTSQFFANVYLNPFDHFIKEGLRIRYYVRYMDDMVFFSHSKAELREVLKTIESYLCCHLKLVLNPGATLLHSSLHGLPFLGFRIFPGLLRIKKDNLKRIKKRLSASTQMVRCDLSTDGLRALFVSRCLSCSGEYPDE